MSNDQGSGAGPNEVDVHVGGRLRRLRSLRNMSQQALGEALGISFQQVQKYEKGTNRISASKLYEITQSLGISVDYFFNGLNAQEEASEAQGFAEPEAPAYSLDANPREGLELIKAFNAIPNPTLRKQVLDMVKSIAEDHAAKEP